MGDRRGLCCRTATCRVEPDVSTPRSAPRSTGRDHVPSDAQMASRVLDRHLSREVQYMAFGRSSRCSNKEFGPKLAEFAEKRAASLSSKQPSRVTRTTWMRRSNRQAVRFTHPYLTIPVPGRSRVGWWFRCRCGVRRSAADSRRRRPWCRCRRGRSRRRVGGRRGLRLSGG